MLKYGIEIFEKSAIYNGFIKNMPYPFNDIYFVSAVLFITMCLIVLYIIQWIRIAVIKKRIKKKQEIIRLERLSEEEKEKNERNEFMEYMRENAKKQGKDIEKEKEYELTHDMATGLLNRFSYNKALEALNINSLLVIYIDINNLKKTNDQYGKAYGDRLLKAVADELKDSFPKNCYRVGGDEFIVLINGMSERIAYKKIEKIRGNLDALTESDAEGVIYSAAFGIAVSDGSMVKQELIDLAEERMKQDKLGIKQKAAEKYGDDHYVDERIKITDAEEEKNLDIMTGCKTKEAYEEMIKTINETNLSIISADIDGLKVINDRLSHHAGDTVIKGFSMVLKKYFKGCVYRISDDDFLVVTNKESRESLYKKLDSVKRELIKLTENAEEGLFYSASFGISTNAGDGDLLMDSMLDECLIQMNEDKEAYRSGKRKGVTVNENSSLSDTEAKIPENSYDFDIDEILDEKRREDSSVEIEDEGDALTSLLYSMASKREEDYKENEDDEKRRIEKEKREELLNEEIKARYNKEDLTSHKKSSVKQKKVTEEMLRSEVERMKKEETRKKKGLFKKSGTDSDSSSTGSLVSGNTVNDVDIL